MLDQCQGNVQICLRLRLTSGFRDPPVPTGHHSDARRRVEPAGLLQQAFVWIPPDDFRTSPGKAAGQCARAGPHVNHAPAGTTAKRISRSKKDCGKPALYLA